MLLFLSVMPYGSLHVYCRIAVFVSHALWLVVKSGQVSDPANAARRWYKEAKSVFWRELRKLKQQEVDRFYSSLDLSD